ncbi:DUF3011 domain-containing protein [Xanthomonas nasturtii]|uniref:DUF3011 domain-containing protein n=1 Tax=Xanthomonas nasturtii TaxID=1843581 RepID=UPI002012DB6D|nr:DUF3011 domain-containing protein [Xanthomonas nasturtii]MCL1527552.1 DUF3011 domain-containing protein [Xanthomonas nasturtii]MCL1533408.1 DUF3011 domain-containing protein [Xanthomonas nasturtii]MCL1544449.1 DUF3011 domain-containing protein [Xanthomonas nasturtii]
MKKFIAVGVVSLAGAISLAPASAAIQQFNGTCPGGVEVHADQGGPVYINGRETRLKRFNDDYYEASDGRGLTLSINRTPDGGTQMSYTGPGNDNGVCSVRASARDVQPRDQRTSSQRYSENSAAATVTCASEDRKQHECAMDTRGEVIVSRQISKTRCVRGDNWDVNRHSIWVKDGCRAEFRNVSRDSGARNSWRQDTGGRHTDLMSACNTRARADGEEVTRVAVNQDLTELIINYPDGRYGCLVHDDGTVQSFTRLGRQR